MAFSEPYTDTHNKINESLLIPINSRLTLSVAYYLSYALHRIPYEAILHADVTVNLLLYKFDHIYVLPKDFHLWPRAVSTSQRVSADWQ